MIGELLHVHVHAGPKGLMGGGCRGWVATNI